MGETEESAPVAREVSFEEAMAIARVGQQNGQLAEAEEVYRQMLEVAPNHPDVLHYSGVLTHQQGRSDEALALIERSLALEPNRAEWHNNLGIILKATGRFEEAIAAYERAIALDPGHANAYNNIGVLLRATGKLAEAETAYRKAIELNPEYAGAYHNLGVLLSSLKRTHEAVMCFCTAATLGPRQPETRKLLALAYCTLGQRDKAVEIFEEWLNEEPANPIATHMLAACSGRNVPPRASDGYVEQGFDNFAATFESRLAGLSYRAPALVGAMLQDSGLEVSKSLDVLDAGCGTGLCAELIAPYARELIGVDLSRGMLVQAAQKNIYDELVKDEITNFLRSRTAAFDVIVSADTLVYFGVLDEVAAAAAAALRQWGLFIFTVEELVDAQQDADFRIEPHGRYAHSRSYVERVLAECNLQADIVRAELRMESGLPVGGLVIRARKGTISASGRLTHNVNSDSSPTELINI